MTWPQAAHGWYWMQVHITQGSCLGSFGQMSSQGERIWYGRDGLYMNVGEKSCSGQGGDVSQCHPLPMAVSAAPWALCKAVVSSVSKGTVRNPKHKEQALPYWDLQAQEHTGRQGPGSGLVMCLFDFLFKNRENTLYFQGFLLGSSPVKGFLLQCGIAHPNPVLVLTFPLSSGFFQDWPRFLFFFSSSF